MRFIKISQVEPGMILGKSLYTPIGELLLQAGIALSDEYIERIKKMDYSGVYINDYATREIIVDEIISDEMKVTTIENLHTIFMPEVETYEPAKLVDSIRSLQENMFKVVNDIMSNPHVIVNMTEMKSYSDITYFHSINVSVLAVAIGTAMKLSYRKVTELGMAAILHDVGKRYIPTEILTKKTRLTDAEFIQMKEHPRRGYEFLGRNQDFSDTIRKAVLQHHEKYDGSGYPSGRRGDEICTYAKIICIADTYESMTSQRPNHKPVLPSEAYEFILAGAGIFFDPKIVRVFSRCVATYPVGTTVVLSNGRKAVVAENYSGYTTRPRIKLLDEEGARSYLDLKDDPDMRHITIVGVE